MLLKWLQLAETCRCAALEVAVFCFAGPSPTEDMAFPKGGFPAGLGAECCCPVPVCCRLGYWMAHEPAQRPGRVFPEEITPESDERLCHLEKAALLALQHRVPPSGQLQCRSVGSRDSVRLRGFGRLSSRSPVAPR